MMSQDGDEPPKRLRLGYGLETDMGSLPDEGWKLTQTGHGAVGG